MLKKLLFFCGLISMKDTFHMICTIINIKGLSSSASHTHPETNTEYILKTSGITRLNDSHETVS